MAGELYNSLVKLMGKKKNLNLGGRITCVESFCFVLFCISII